MLLSRCSQNQCFRFLTSSNIVFLKIISNISDLNPTLTSRPQTNSMIPLVAHKTNYLLDLEQLRVAMAKSDKINSSSSLNHASSLSNDSPNTNKMTVDDVLRQLDSLSCPTPASFKHVTNIRDSKCDFLVADVILMKVPCMNIAVSLVVPINIVKCLRKQLKRFSIFLIRSKISIQTCRANHSAATTVVNNSNTTVFQK